MGEVVDLGGLLAPSPEVLLIPDDGQSLGKGTVLAAGHQTDIVLFDNRHRADRDRQVVAAGQLVDGLLDHITDRPALAGVAVVVVSQPNTRPKSQGQYGAAHDWGQIQPTHQAVVPDGKASCGDQDDHHEVDLEPRARHGCLRSAFWAT